MATLGKIINTAHEPVDPDAQLVGLDYIAHRWAVARPTAQRILEAAGVQALFLSGAVRGVRRYRLADVRRVEDGSRAK